MGFERSIDRCVRCGFCLTTCPTYRLTDDELSSPRGRIALAQGMIDGAIDVNSDSVATFSQCVGCRACESACPSGVIYEEVLLYGREQVAHAGERLPWHARLLLFGIRSPLRLKFAAAFWPLMGRLAIRAAQMSGANHPAVSLLASAPPPVLRPETGQTIGPPEGEVGWRGHVGRLARRFGVARRRGNDAPIASVAIHRGCLMDVFWSRTNERAAELLGRAGLPTTLLPLGVGCCGALHAHQGDRETARALARRVISGFERSETQTMVNLAGGCSAFLKEYPDLFDHADPWHGRAQRLADAVSDIASLLIEHGYTLKPAGNERTTYQDSCHLRHGMKVWREPRELLRQAGAYTELPGADQCCGSAGIYNMIHPEIAGEMLAAKMQAVSAAVPDVLVTSNPGCELQLRLGVRKANAPIRVMHLVDYLYERSEGL